MELLLAIASNKGLFRAHYYYDAIAFIDHIR
jgi:hypothetical protein